MAESIKINLRADSGQLRAEFGKASGSVKRFGKDTSDSLKKVVAFGSGLLGLKAGLGVLESLREQFDRVGKLSNRFNLPVEVVQKLSLAAELTGSDIEKLVAGLTKATVAGQEAGLGLQTYVRQFDALGIEIDEFNRATPDQKLSILANAFRDAEDEATAFTAAYRILGKAGGDLIPLLRGGAEGIEKITKNLNTLDEGQIRAVEKFNDQLTLLKANLQAGLAGAFTEKDLEELVRLLEGLGQVVGSVTRFLIRNGEALGDLLKIYVGYRVALKAIDFGRLISGLVSSSTSFRKSTAAITSQTAALNANTAAKSKNAGVTLGGASGALGAVGLAASIPSFFDLGQSIGNSIYDKFFSNEEEFQAELEARAQLEKRILAEANRERDKQAQRDEVAAENARYRAEQEKLVAAARKRNAEILERRRSELLEEVRGLAKNVIEVEVGFLTPEKQLQRLENTTGSLMAEAESLARRSGVALADSASPLEVLRSGVRAGDKGELIFSRELLQIAEKLRTQTEAKKQLEEQIASVKKEQAAIAAREAIDEERRSEKRRDLAIEIRALQLESNGRGVLANRLRDEVSLRKDAKRLAEEAGISEQRALSLLRERARLEKSIADDRKEAFEPQVVARGSFKLSPRRGEELAGQRLRGVPDIGFSGGIGNSVRRSRIGAREAADRRKQQESKEAQYFERLIEKSESLLEIWQRLNSI